jgi:hypothetical protein
MQLTVVPEAILYLARLNATTLFLSRQFQRQNSSSLLLLVTLYVMTRRKPSSICAHGVTWEVLVDVRALRIDVVLQVVSAIGVRKQVHPLVDATVIVVLELLHQHPACATESWMPT